MKCRDFMRRPVETLGEGMTVEAAASRMRDANIGFIPIVDAQGFVQGVVTDRDIAVRVVAAGLAVSTPCESVMTTDLVWCSPEEHLETVAHRMSRAKKSRILVLEDRRLVGIVSLADVAAIDAPMAALALHAVAAREVLDVAGTVQIQS